MSENDKSFIFTFFDSVIKWIASFLFFKSSLDGGALLLLLVLYLEVGYDFCDSFITIEGKLPLQHSFWEGSFFGLVEELLAQ